MTGKQSLLFDKDVYVRCTATVVGKKEADGPLGEMFDVAVEDDMFGKKSWEEAESHIQEMAVDKLLIKSGMAASDIDYIYAGDLLGQLIATSFGLMRYEIPMFGLYGACSTMGEALSLGAMCVNAGYAQNVIAIASSHFASAEKQFRYPLEYGNQRPVASTWTVTGAGAYIVGDKPLDKKKCVLIKGITTGKIVDYGVKDSMNMGACMAPAACDTIIQNLEDFDQEGIREMTKPLFSIPPHQFLFNAGSIDKRSYMEMLQLDEAEYNLIKFPQRGVCLYKCGNERYLLEVHAPAYKEKLFGTAGGR